ncbi:5-formyltetrahydrofolate cyclo-ligase [Hydrogenophaga sp.]|uniref:5-formyltetrahydrofolate cyclo-ligase n=1 Tax=Hydrogenophaga sp. TaxID=1904254 RepID=UPI0019C46555|nr:5-formyltetrahydrofolate cyclo-ligase [Hydrogenophaga sp.]MBD3892836.1 5-formyltetrahydrofolate cyclo-ligase [Hydrogenophaga sp.]
MDNKDNKDGSSSHPAPQAALEDAALAGQKTIWRLALVKKRQLLADRAWRNDLLQRVMRVWLIGRPDTTIGAYWPIKAEFDPLPALFRWQEAGQEEDAQSAQRLRRIGLPVVNKVHKTLSFHTWYPGCPMDEDAYGIPKPKDTEAVVPTLIFVPCVGFGPGGYRLGYGGGFYDRTLASLNPRPFTVGLGYDFGYLPQLRAQAHDVPLDAILTDAGVIWPPPRGV